VYGVRRHTANTPSSAAAGKATGARRDVADRRVVAVQLHRRAVGGQQLRAALRELGQPVAQRLVDSDVDEGLRERVQVGDVLLLDRDPFGRLDEPAGRHVQRGQALQQERQRGLPGRRRLGGRRCVADERGDGPVVELGDVEHGQVVGQRLPAELVRLLQALLAVRVVGVGAHVRGQRGLVRLRERQRHRARPR
jgi:hypothetical protein